MSWTRLVLLSAALAAAQLDPGLTPHKAPKPSLPRIDQNACPFEGCQFGQWKARERIQLFSTWKATRKPIRILHKGEAVTAITGTYITLEPSEIQVTAPIPQFGLKPGDRVFGYMNLGEGVFNAWFNGVWVQEFDGSGVHWPSADSGCSRNCNGIGRKPGRFEWWVKIKTKDGVIGWTRDTDKFDGKDALAGDSGEAIIRSDGRTRSVSAKPSPGRNQTAEPVTVRGILSRGGKAGNVWTLTLDYPLEARDLRGANLDKTVVLRLLRFIGDSQRPQDRGFDGKHVELRGSLRFPFGLDTARVTVQTMTILQEEGRAQQLPPSDDSRHSMLRAEMHGIFSPPVAVPIARAQRDCVELPTDPPNDRLEGPHGDTLISAMCKVTAYENLGGLTWSVARYQWRSIFTAQDRSRGDDARDTVVEEEVVLFEAQGSELRAVWHARFETGEFAALRSITPEIAQMNDGTMLLSVMSCVNGTGGCGQEFLHRHSDGRWFPVEQKWRDQLPRGYSDRIRHGVRIDPETLRGQAGFYGDEDPNCCPSQELFVRLALQEDALVLAGPPIVRQSNRDSWVRDSSLRHGSGGAMAVVQRSRELRKELRQTRDNLHQSIKTLNKEAAEFEKAEATAGLDVVKTLLNKFNIGRAELGFLRAELQVGMSLADFALRAKRGDVIERNRVNARKAYDAVVRFMPGVKLAIPEVNEIKTKLGELKSKLKLLGEDV